MTGQRQKTPPVPDLKAAGVTGLRRRSYDQAHFPGGCFMKFPSVRQAGLALALLLAPALLPGLAPVAVADAPKEFGVNVGETAPAISGVTQTGAPATFESLKGEKGMVLAFFRSADWCPFCKAQLEDLETVAAGLKAEGYPLVALSYDPVETLKTFADKKMLTYTLVSDPESKVIDAFGVRNEEVRSSKRMNGIPHPVIYVIGADGVIKSKFFEESYRKRPPSSLVLETVKALP